MGRPAAGVAAGGQLPGSDVATGGTGGVGPFVHLDNSHGEILCEVVHKMIMLRSAPSIKSQPKGMLLKGSRIKGHRQKIGDQPWLRLSEQVVDAMHVDATDDIWALMDASTTDLGLGELLRHITLEQIREEEALAMADEVLDGEDEEDNDSEAVRAPRIMCLPGIASGKAIFERQAANLFRLADGSIEFIVIDPPVKCNDIEALEQMMQYFKGNPMMMYDEVQLDDRSWIGYDQPRKVLDWLQSQLKDHAPIDGIMGFSQGANFAAMLAAQSVNAVGAKLSFVCLFSPYAPGYVDQLPDLFTDEALQIPALVVRGEKEDYDEAMKKRLRGLRIDRKGKRMPSDHVVRLFCSAETLTHGDGHRVLPSDHMEAEWIAKHVIDFIIKRSRGPVATIGSLEPGAVVRLHSLQSVLSLNGSEGTVVRWDKGKERWVVRVKQEAKLKLLNAANLSVQNVGVEDNIAKRNQSDHQNSQRCIDCGGVAKKKLSNGDRCCAHCWASRVCGKCRKVEGTNVDERGARFCDGCWLRRFCVKCKTEIGTEMDDDGHAYCTDCWLIHTRCVVCEESAGEQQGEDGEWYCAVCWETREMKRLRLARKSQYRLLKELHEHSRGVVCPAPPETPQLKEFPADALRFLLRFGLGSPTGCEQEVEGDDELPYASLFPRPSPAQGTCFIGGFELTSEFDGGNAPVEQWSVLTGEDNSLEGFSLRIEPDTLCNSMARGKSFWFSFGMRPVNPKSSSGARFRLKVSGLSYQEDLFDHGYAPVCHTPTRPVWRRVPGAIEYRKDKDEAGEPSGTWSLTWTHQLALGDVDGMTYFAFCYPFSFGALQLHLAELERLVAMASLDAKALALELPCPHDRHAACPCCGDGEARELRCEARRAGRNVYFHRQTLACTPQSRIVELLTVTQAEGGAEAELPCPRDCEELPPSVQGALGGLPSEPPRRFRGRPVCFASARVHPGETPGQFALLGLLHFLLSDDPRAALLRALYVFKLVPMLNPDGVAWGKTRTSSLGYDLNRCYQDPEPELHEGVAAVKAVVKQWGNRGELHFYLDCHAHGSTRGCFVYGNMQAKDEDFVTSVHYPHLLQLNCPHIDIDSCRWSTAPGTRADQAEHDSGRAQIGSCCSLPLAYTLECNYNTGQLTRPVVEVPGLPAHASATQLVRGPTMGRGGRFAPVAFDPGAWEAVGEAFAVSLLDAAGRNPFSRLLVARPPALLNTNSNTAAKDLAHKGDVVSRLSGVFDRLADRCEQADRSDVF